MSQTYYVKIPSSNIGLHQPQVEPWHQRGERERLARSRPGPSADAQAIERSLLDQVAGAGNHQPEVSPQFEAAWAQFQASQQKSRREVDLETKLFEQIQAAGFQPDP